MRRRAWIAAGACAVFPLLGGCGGGEEAVGTEPEAAGAATAAAAPAPSPRPLRAPPCPGAAVNCERASGRIVYVERVDPDGDGDAHFVLVGDDGITASGISVIDVEAALRPEPLPRPGDLLAASGPVYEGSYGQLQIEADAVRFRRIR